MTISCIQQQDSKNIFLSSHFHLHETIRSCGFFMLIHHLMSFAPDSKSTFAKTHRPLKIAEELLRNFQRTRISVKPPNKKAALLFIHYIIDQALLVRQNSMEHNSQLQQYAANLLGALKNLQQDPQSDSILKLFETHWNEFSASFFKMKLCELMKEIGVVA